MSKAWFLLPAVLLITCGRSPYPGYKEAGEGVHLRYIALGEGEQLANDSDSVYVRFRMARLGEAPGSFWSSEQWYLAQDLREGAMRPVLRRMHVGDSMSVIAPTLSWPWKALAKPNAYAQPDTTRVCTELSLLAIRTPAQVREAAQRMKQNDPAGYERRLIATYIGRSPIQWTRWGTSDMHYSISGAPRDTNRSRTGQLVHLKWTGRRLEDGLAFDEVTSDGEPFHWSYGTPDQVIQGIETAVSLMREGQEGIFIFPSSLAFGGRGIPGSLEPWSPVIYEVQVLKVDRDGG